MARRKKTLLTVCAVLLVLACCIYANMYGEAKKHVTEGADDLMQGILSGDYSRIANNAKKANGEELTKQEVWNYLQNTGLYKLMLCANMKLDARWSCETKVSFLNIDEGRATVVWKGPFNETITQTFPYIDIGTDRFFVFDELQTPDLEVSCFPMALDLANGDYLSYDGNDAGIFDGNEEDWDVVICKENGDGEVYLEIIEDALPYCKLGVSKFLEDVVTWIKHDNEEYCIVYDPGLTMFDFYSDYCEHDLLNNPMLYTSIYICSIWGQTMEGKEDWHLTFNYYDEQTNELLSSYTLR